VQTAVPTPLLDARAVLYDARGAVVAAADPAESMQVALRAEDLAAGKYYLEVASHGDYGELGRYEVTVSSGLPASLEPIAHLALNGHLLTDTSGAGHDGIWSGSPKWTPGSARGAAAAFDGTNCIHIPAGRGDSPCPAGLRSDAPSLSGSRQTPRPSPENKSSQKSGEIRVQTVSGGRQAQSHASTTGAVRLVWRVTLVAEVPLESGRCTTPRSLTGDVLEDREHHRLYLDGKEAARGAAGPVPDASRFEVGGPAFAGAVKDVWVFGEVVRAT